MPRVNQLTMLVSGPSLDSKGACWPGTGAHFASGTIFELIYRLRSCDGLIAQHAPDVERGGSPTISQEGELVWTGVTDTFNSSKPHKAINGLVKLLVKQMQIDGRIEGASVNMKATTQERLPIVTSCLRER